MSQEIKDKSEDRNVHYVGTVHCDNRVLQGERSEEWHNDK